MNRWFRVCILLLLAPTIGCAGFWQFHQAQAKRRSLDRDVRRASQTDRLWKEGYGFNNPNPERRRNGLDVVNFDGRTDSERSRKSSIVGRYFGDLTGDAVIYGFKRTFESIAQLRR